MMEWVLGVLAPIDGIDRTFILTNQRFASDFEAWAADYCSRNTERALTLVNDGSTDDSNRLGALGDLDLALDREQIDDDIIVVAGDNLFSENLSDFGRYCREKRAPILGIYDVGSLEAIRRFSSIQVDREGRITAFEEKPMHAHSTVAGIALYFYPRTILPLIKKYVAEGNNPDQPGRLVQWLFPQIPFYTWKVPGRWFDIGTVETLEEANKLFSGKLLRNRHA
jgi:glucose-1-phosphate thymidylyltransferase